MSVLQSQRQAQVIIEMRKQITAEAVAGIWSAEEARKKIVALLEEDQPPPSKRQKVVRIPSPDWDSDNFYASEGEA